MKILIVDDEIRIREVVKEYALVNGYVCDEASDGKSAVNMALATDYDCIILDIMMPVMDGYEATRQIRAGKRAYWQNLPVIAMTANVFQEDKRHAAECGMSGFVSKPIDMEVIYSVLEKWLPKIF